MHEDQIDPVDVVQIMRQRGQDSRYRVERKKRLTGEIIGRDHVVIHNREQDHGGFMSALVQRNGTENIYYEILSHLFFTQENYFFMA